MAVLGAGPVGRALVDGLHRAGRTVRVGVRSPDDAKYQDLDAAIEVVTIEAAVAASDVTILAVPADALGSVLSTTSFEPGHIVIDACNAVFTAMPEGFDSIGDFVASRLGPGVGFVKAFNTIGAEHLGNGAFDDGRAFLPIAGDPLAVEAATELATMLGFDAVALGGRDVIGMVEDHARLWIHLAFRCGWGRDFGFTRVQR